MSQTLECAFNRKQAYSINIQAAVGTNLNFAGIVTGFPGSMHDARVFMSTTLHDQGEKGRILSSYFETTRSSIEPLILTDRPYPALRQLPKLYVKT